VLFHDYRDGSVIDRSGNGNDGHPNRLNMVPGRTPQEQALHFNGIDDRVVVFPSETLQQLGALRVSAWIWLEKLDRRRTIVEGFLSFALSVDPDGSLRAGIYNGLKWQSLQSDPAIISLREWIRVTYIYDGVDTSMLYAGPKLVAQDDRYLGRVQGVAWPFGLSIGAWPDADKLVFQGKIAEVKLWRNVG
jgi:hypothetical protein